MIRLYSGLLGSGKTYRVVYELLYTDLLKRYFVFHNIEGLNIENEYLKSYHKDSDFGYSYAEIFTMEFQKQLAEKIKEKYNRPILFIIDEADKIGFDRSNLKIKEWVSLSRHIGEDIYLITQKREQLAKEYVGLIEVEIMAKKGYVFRSLLYTWLSQGQVFAHDRLKKKKEVYLAYKSFHIKEVAKGNSKLLKIVLILAIVLVIAVLAFVKLFYSHTDKHIKGGSIIPDIMKSKNDDSKIVKNNNYDDRKYYYYGKIEDKVYLVDQYGNMYDFDQYESDLRILKIDDYRKVLDAVNNSNSHIKFKVAYIEARRTGSSSPTSGRGGTSDGEDKSNVVYRPAWIYIK
jgi:hypothetical protein